jgi:plasmid stabilization system protein ParE
MARAAPSRAKWTFGLASPVQTARCVRRLLAFEPPMQASSARKRAEVRESRMDRNRLFGGNPVAVIVRLVILSVVVGIVLHALNIQPHELLDRLNLLIRRLFNLGFESFEQVLRFFLIGAVVVIPIWLIARLLGLLSKKQDDGRP